ncbi:hypothetical protein [Nocardiopsis mwathae]|uniref:hypothetical protein n=1 Tax=Nocardiopsis mwathae TaxID=1472723 RepID=UPI003743F0D6
MEQLRSRLAQVIGRVMDGGTSAAVTRDGTVAAVLISPGGYEDLRRLRDERDRRVVLERRAAAQAHPSRMVAFDSARRYRPTFPQITRGSQRPTSL